ncbi:ATP-dependent RNA helicase HrpA [Angustibacter sp. Root456]|uniref:ATP-dependent RNA helicase HrpA n=1 Tax=Angustibacter sp. Root456 TaxID=1736539 RepID=UPI0006FDFAA5|nr:ATP-dependent RNA helicase HrpA [Angustibacter sp. Root456]
MVEAVRHQRRDAGRRRRGLTPQQVEARRASVPAITYPDLPVSAVRDDIAVAIRDHQVVIVAGETGSGKTTQLPKICLELGRGVEGTIGHTQPRRIAARTVAERIAEELGTPVGELVGWSVRFTDRTSAQSLVRVMTDGILLAEIQRDRLLSRYDTLIIDEAHERSLNVDFLLGYLKQLLPKRPDLKVIITSATIDPERFSQHFGGAPILEVSGRTYPVEVRYRPVIDPDDPDPDPDRDQVQAVCDAVVELSREGDGDVLVFLSGEREIRDTAEALRALDLRRTEVLPLYARLSSAEQHRVFEPHSGRRVVLATNVAETSLTVPGVRYVVDTGTARISRYSRRLKVQRLPIEPISQASANQRAGRCGRVADGICIRLYSEDDYESRPRFTDPEILRTNLASVILQMTAIGLGDIAAFPFVEPPDRRSVRDGVQLLHELGAIDAEGDDRRLTRVGRQLAQLPLDPRLARMVLQGDREGCLREVLVVAAALSIQDPRERPADAQAQADQQHARFRDPTSDFVTWLNLWNYLREQQKALSGSAFRRMCKAEYLHYLRVREWQDVHSQLKQVVKQLGLERSSSPTDADALHRAMLAGLLSHVGLRDAATRDYLGARGARFAIWPGSSVARKPPQYVMAAELVETSRLWGRTVAKIEPEWAEVLAPHLISRTFSEPHWSSKRAAVMARERVTLYGVPLVADRLVGYSKVDPELSRELFIRHALVEGDWRTHHRFFAANRELLQDVEALEQRARRRDLLVDDQVLFDFYDARIPADVVSGRHFDGWWKKARREQPELLTFTPDLLVRDDAEAVSDEDYPTTWVVADAELPVTYQFEPGTAADGVTVHVPLPVLGRLRPEPFEWQIPGLRHELVTQLIRSLPKAVRRSLIPAPDRAADVLRHVAPSDGPLLEVLSDTLHRLTGTHVDLEDWAPESVPGHLRVTFRIEDPDGRVLGEGKDLRELQQRLRPKLREVIARAPDSIEREGLRQWDVGALPSTHRTVADGHVVEGFPALVDTGDSVALRVLTTADEAAAHHAGGVRRLLRLAVPSPVPFVLAKLSNGQKLVLSRARHATATELVEDCTDATVDLLVDRQGGAATVRTAERFAEVLAAVRAGLDAQTLDVVQRVERVLAAAYDVESRVKGTTSLPLLPSLTDLQAHLDRLIRPRFVTSAGAERLPDLLRYVQAMAVRLDRLPDDPVRDRNAMAQVQMAQDELDDALARVPRGRAPSQALLDVRWMIEELRVSLFAPTMRTAHPVSVQRVHRAIVAA